VGGEVSWSGVSVQQQRRIDRPDSCEFWNLARSDVGWSKLSVAGHSDKLAVIPSYCGDKSFGDLW